MRLAEIDYSGEPSCLAERVQFWLAACATRDADHYTEIGVGLVEAVGSQAAAARDGDLAAAREVKEIKRLLRAAVTWAPATRIKQIRAVISGDLDEVASDNTRDLEGPDGLIVTYREPYLHDAEHGVFLLCGPQGVERRQVCRTAPIPTAIMEDGTGKQTVRLAWRQGRGWRSVDLPRSVAADSRAVVAALASEGVDVSTRSGGDFVGWIATCLAYSDLPVMRVVRHVGWCEPGNPSAGVLYGREYLSAHGERCPAVYAGPDLVAERYAQSGDIEDWKREVWEPMRDQPIACAVVYAALSAALIAPLRLDSYAIELGCGSSRGKTSLLRVAASATGIPTGPRGQTYAWSSSKKGLALSAAMLVGLPMIADDTREAADPSMVTDLIYAVAQVGVRVVSTQTQEPQHQAPCHTVLMLTGEAPHMATVDDKEGGRARMVSISSDPWTVSGEAGHRLVSSLAAASERLYGAVGRAWMQALASLSPDEWEQLAEDVKTAQDAAAKGGGIAGRAMKPIAIIDTTSKWLDRLIGLPRRPAATRALVAEARRTQAEADWPTRAIHMVWEASAARRADLFIPHQKRRPAREWVGRLDIEPETGRMKGLAWRQSFVEEVLGGRQRAAPAIAAWDERGWLEHGPDRRDKQARIDGMRTWLLALSPGALEMLGAHDPAEEGDRYDDDQALQHHDGDNTIPF